MIKIVFKNGCVVKWKKKQWTDYKYDGKCFIIIKDEEWIGIYNMDSVISVVVKKEKKAKKRRKNNYGNRD